MAMFWWGAFLSMMTLIFVILLGLGMLTYAEPSIAIVFILGNFISGALYMYWGAKSELGK